jgi:hypothetical protein
MIPLRRRDRKGAARFERVARPSNRYNRCVESPSREMSTHLESSESTSRGGGPLRLRRVRFQVRTLLIAPIVLAALLLVAFPKLVSGDFVEATITSVEDYGSGIVIKMDAWQSSQTGWGASLNYGPFFGVGISSERIHHCSDFIPTWPKHELITINLSFNSSKLPKRANNRMDVVRVGEHEVLRIDVHQPATIAQATSLTGEQGKCTFEVSLGDRLGL